MVILGLTQDHPNLYKLMILIDVVNELCVRLMEKACYQPDMLEALVQLIKTEFNESSWEVFTSALKVRWPKLSTLN